MNKVLVYLIEGILIGLIIDIIVFLIMTKRSIDLEKRVTHFSISSINEKQSSLFDRAYLKYSKIISKITNVLSKSKLISRISNKYDKYLDRGKDIRIRAINIISNKILLSVFAVFLVIVTDAIQKKEINIIQIIIAILIGYLTPDIVLAIKSHKKSKQVENDLLKAVLIMSNAFKSGRSIMQAVKIVSEELDGPVAEEFKKIYVDLNYGLDIDVAFDRLSSRMKLEETKYMASSLAILNKTGGNVVKVFNSIENSFFERKKLNDELKSVTALSDFVFKVLIVIPFVIFIMIYLFNKTYFAPFVTTNIGRMILVLILVIYILYIIFVRRIMKIRD